MAEVTKNVGEGRFEVHVDGELAGRLDYQVGDLGVIDLTHTEVEEKFGGQGLAGQLVRYALDDIRSQGYRVEPTCEYVQGWLGKHPEYADLVSETRAATDTDTSAEAMDDVTSIDTTTDQRI